MHTDVSPCSSTPSKPPPPVPHARSSWVVFRWVVGRAVRGHAHNAGHADGSTIHCPPSHAHIPSQEAPAALGQKPIGGSLAPRPPYDPRSSVTITPISRTGPCNAPPRRSCETLDRATRLCVCSRAVARTVSALYVVVRMSQHDVPLAGHGCRSEVLGELQRWRQREQRYTAAASVQGYSLPCDAAVYDTPPLLPSFINAHLLPAPSSSPVHPTTATEHCM